MSYAPRPIDPEAIEGSRRFMRWAKTATPAQIRKALGKPSFNPCDCFGAEEAKRLRAEVAALKHRMKMAQRSLRAALRTGGYMEACNDAEMVLDVRRPLHDRSRRGAR